MKFINSQRVIARMAIVAITFLVLGCANPSAKKPKGVTEGVNGNNNNPNASVLPKGPATPNPYLQQKPNTDTAIAQQFKAATSAMRVKHWAHAETLLTQLVAQNPKLSGAWLNLGLVYRAQNNEQGSEEAFTRAVKANPLNVDAYNQLAILLREQGRFAHAETQYLNALKIWPFHADSHKNLGILYDLYMGKSAQALAHFEAYQQLRGNSDKQVAGWIADLRRRLGIKAPEIEAQASISDTADTADSTSTKTDGEDAMTTTEQ